MSNVNFSPFVPQQLRTRVQLLCLSLSCVFALFCTVTSEAESFLEPSDQSLAFLQDTLSGDHLDSSLQALWGNAAKEAPKLLQLRSLKLIEASGLQQARLENIPWTSINWPHRLGGIARPSNDPKFDRYASQLKDPVSKIDDTIDYLSNLWPLDRTTLLNLPLESRKLFSPSIKYDLLVGDSEFSLTRQVFEQLRDLKDRKAITLWSGLCHGMAPAALALSRPIKPVNAVTASGQVIPFYPEDLEALISLLWSNSYIHTNDQLIRVYGEQCQSKNETNVTNTPRCRGINPAFLHLLLVNLIGVEKHGLIVDRSLNSVLNVPVFGYRFQYFNPLTGQKTGRFLDSLVSASVSEPKMSSLLARADKLTSHVVGIEMTIQFRDELTELDHTPRTVDSIPFIREQTFRYTLELDNDSMILGGEWYGPSRLNHPDLAWYIEPGTLAYSFVDFDLPNKSAVEASSLSQRALPPEWAVLAKKASLATTSQGIDQGRVGTPTPQPLATVIYQLLKESAGSVNPSL